MFRPRIRTKLLTFPLMAALLVSLAFFTAWALRESQNELLDRFAREDLAKAQQVSALFEELASQLVILEFLSWTAVELRDENLYDFGQRFLDTLRGVIREVEALPKSYPLTEEERALIAETLAALSTHQRQVAQAVEMAGVNATAAARMFHEASRDSPRLRAAFTRLVEASRGSSARDHGSPSRGAPASDVAEPAVRTRHARGRDPRVAAGPTGDGAPARPERAHGARARHRRLRGAGPAPQRR
jgi:DNA-directed RNA polymerase specialized sigma24 family protein